MNRLQFSLSKHYKMLRQQAVLLCTIMMICLLSSNALAAMPQQSSGEDQSILIIVGETSLAKLKIVQGKVLSVPIMLQSTDKEVGIGALSINVRYDSTYLQPVGCVTGVGETLYVYCNHDRQPDMISLNAIDTGGLFDTVNLGELKFHALGPVGTTADLELEIKSIADVDGKALSPVGQSGIVEIIEESPATTGCTQASLTTCDKYNIYLPILR